FELIANDSRSCGGIFDVDAKRERLTELESRMGEAGFWNNQQTAQDVVQQVKTLRGWIEPFDALDSRVKSSLELDEMLSTDRDEAMEAELETELAGIDQDVEAFRLKSLLSGPDDFRDAQVEISAGAGGTEAQDWAEMLLRMCTRWAERRGYG